MKAKDGAVGRVGKLAFGAFAVLKFFFMNFLVLYGNALVGLSIIIYYFFYSSTYIVP